jgi:hypothetical protein
MEDNVSPFDNGFDYYPLQKGMYSIFDVTETRYSPLSSPVTLNYELMMEAVDSFPNVEGAYNYVIHRFTRENSGAEWAFLDSHTARANDTEAVVTEDNIPYVKLVFPLSGGIRWDGNRRNNLESDDYAVKTIDAPVTVNNITFDNTLTVEQESYDDQVTRTDIRTEIFARDVGMILKETRQLTYCTEVVCLDDRIIESGVIFQQVIKEYGIH